MDSTQIEDKLKNFSYNTFLPHKRAKTQVKEVKPAEKTLKVSKKEQRTVKFNPGTQEIYAIKAEDEFYVACAGSHIKMYSYSLQKPIHNIYDSEETFYCLDIAEKKNNQQLLAAGGVKGVIRLVDLVSKEEKPTLEGHRNEIYDLCFSRKDSAILASASSDTSIRVWNVIKRTQLFVLGGPEGHQSEVCSVDWHLSGNQIVSSGIDSAVKIWELPRNEKKLKIVVKPRFSCHSVHTNYVDSVKFYGNLVISKSVDGKIKLWKPIENKGSDYFLLLSVFEFPAPKPIWFVKLSLDRNLKFLSCGTPKGTLYLWDLDKLDSTDDFYVSVKEELTVKPKFKGIVRQAVIKPDYSALLWSSCPGFINIHNLQAK